MNEKSTINLTKVIEPIGLQSILDIIGNKQNQLNCVNDRI